MCCEVCVGWYVRFGMRAELCFGMGLVAGPKSLSMASESAKASCGCCARSIFACFGCVSKKLAAVESNWCSWSGGVLPMSATTGSGDIVLPLDSSNRISRLFHYIQSLTQRGAAMWRRLRWPLLLFFARAVEIPHIQEDQQLQEQVLQSEIPAILIVAKELPENLEKLYNQTQGQVFLATAAQNIKAKLTDNQDQDLIIALPYGQEEKKDKEKLSVFGAEPQDLEEAKKLVLESLPSSNIARLTNHEELSALANAADQHSESKSMCVLFSEKETPPPLFRSIALAYDGKFGFGLANKDLAKQLGIPKVPLLTLFFFDRTKPPKGDQIPLQIVPFEPRMFGGKFSFATISTFVQQYLASKGVGDETTKSKSKSTGQSRKTIGPLPELSTSNWDEACGASKALCAIALLDGSADNKNLENQKEVMRKLHTKNSGGPLIWSWVDATCHVNFASGFDLSETDLPALIVLSPSKKRWARAVGTFDAQTLENYGMSIAKGTRGTSSISSIPTLEDVDCSTVPRGANTIPQEDDALGDEIMAEILEEEKREREAREAELASATVDATAGVTQKDTSKMSPLEKLEADLEDCSAHDLLCIARNAKTHKKIAQRRELEEQLKKIAKKKKKAKKKKAKGG